MVHQFLKIFFLKSDLRSWYLGNFPELLEIIVIGVTVLSIMSPVHESFKKTEVSGIGVIYMLFGMHAIMSKFRMKFAVYGIE
tara:strand:+ start:420 stop:665 length:246 start_codon:yes stop_codon:yes gene_type:complete